MSSRKYKIIKLTEIFKICIFCGVKVNRIENHPRGASCEHIIPISILKNKKEFQDGTNGKRHFNVILSCRRCNSFRGNKSFIFFLKEKNKEFINRNKGMK